MNIKSKIYIKLLLILCILPIKADTICYHSPRFKQLISQLTPEQRKKGIFEADDWGFGYYCNLNDFKSYHNLYNSANEHQQIIDPEKCDPNFLKWKYDFPNITCPPWRNPKEFWIEQLTEDAEGLEMYSKNVQRDLEKLK